MDQFSWLFVAGLVVGGIVRALKTDGASAILTHFFGSEEKPVKLPPRSLPFIALGFGTIGAILDAAVAGDPWSIALKKGAISAALAVFGHELGSSIPKVKEALAILLLVGVATSQPACTPESRSILTDLAAKKLECALAHINLPNSQIIALCALQSGDEEFILRAVAQTRQEVAAEAVRVAEREKAATAQAVADKNQIAAQLAARPKCTTDGGAP